MTVSSIRRRLFLFKQHSLNDKKRQETAGNVHNRCNNIRTEAIDIQINCYPVVFK